MLGSSNSIDFFHELMISEKNINKNNIKWFTRSCSLICRSSVFRKKTCDLTKICCVFLVFVLADLVWCWCHIMKQIFHALFCLISKIFTHRFASLNINYLGWIISDIKQKGMEYLLIIVFIITHVSSTVIIWVIYLFIFITTITITRTTVIIM